LRLTRWTTASLLPGVTLGLSIWLAYPAEAQAPDCTFRGFGCGASTGTDAAGLTNPAALTRSEIVAIQDALIWTGYYNGLKDGGWGNRVEQALREWKRANGFAFDNSLSRNELYSMLSQAASAREAAAWRTVTDQKTGATIGYPARFISPSPAQNGTNYSGNAGINLEVRRYRMSLEAVRTSLGSMARAPDVVRINYRLDRPNRQVLSYDVAPNATVYIRADRLGDDWIGISAKVEHKPAFNNIILAISASFDAAGGAAANPPLSEMPTLGPLMAQIGTARPAPGSQALPSQDVEQKPRTQVALADDPVPKQKPSSAPQSPPPEATPSTAVAGTFSARDIEKIVATNRSNELRFARDYKGKSFSAAGRFKSASEALIGSGFNFTVEAEGGELYCTVSDPAILKTAIDWNRGQSVFINGTIKTTIIGSLVLESGCSITAR